MDARCVVENSNPPQCNATVNNIPSYVLHPVVSVICAATKVSDPISDTAAHIGLCTILGQANLHSLFYWKGNIKDYNIYICYII